MCRQKSNALITIPSIDKHIESNENLIETITNLIEKNTKPCVKNCFFFNLHDKIYSFL
jgi:hypothetical protein